MTASTSGIAVASDGGTNGRTSASVVEMRDDEMAPVRSLRASSAGASSRVRGMSGGSRSRAALAGTLFGGSSKRLTQATIAAAATVAMAPLRLRSIPRRRRATLGGMPSSSGGALEGGANALGDGST